MKICHSGMHGFSRVTSGHIGNEFIRPDESSSGIAAIVGTDTAVWIAVQAGLNDVQTLKLVQGTNVFYTAFSPTPGTLGKTPWPGVVVSGAIDAVKIQNTQDKDIAVRVYDPMLPDPGISAVVSEQNVGCVLATHMVVSIVKFVRASTHPTFTTFT